MPPAAAGLSVYPDLVLPVAVGSACASRRVHRRQLRLDRRPVDQIGNLVQGRSTGFTGKQGFLTNPAAFIPGTEMKLSGIKSAASRADLIAYLALATER